MTELTYLQAISSALRDELRADERVLMMGEDIGVFGGAFKVTDGFIEEFGPDRVMDTPLAESAIIGTRDRRRRRRDAAGVRDAVRRLHLLRLRPAGQRRREDALPPGAGRADHRAAAVRRRLLGRPVPLPEPGGVVHALRPGSRSSRRRPRRTRRGSSTPRSATRTRSVSWSTSTSTGASRARCPTGVYETPFTARIARPGTDLVVIAYGAMVHIALEATEDLDGASIEVLDLRSLVPLDEEAILDSVERCSKVVIVDEANSTCAAGAQVAALIAEKGLRGPRRPGRAGGDARRPDPVLAAAGAGGAARGRARQGGVP